MFFTIAVFASCAEREEPPTIGERLEGFWKGGAWNHPDNRYYFKGGAMWAAKQANGALFDRTDYQYAIIGDTIKILDVTTFERRDYRVEFPTDSTAWLEALPLGVDISLVRIR